MKRRIAVRGIFVNDGTLLCVKLKPYNTAITGEFWCTIGGGVDMGEKRGEHLVEHTEKV